MSRAARLPGLPARRGARLRALALVLALAAGCAGAISQRTALPAAAAEPDAGYEAPPVARARDLLPPDLLAGEHHRVASSVESDGFVRHYTIESDFGRFDVWGDEMLRERIAEIRALAALRERSATREFADAMGRGLKRPFVATWNLLRHPVDSITGLPGDAWGFVKRAGELSRSERGETEDSAFREFIGFEARKREIAGRLDVDPYTTNRALQAALNRYAWVSYAGGLPFMLVPFQGRDDGLGGPLPGLADERRRLMELLSDSSPEDLRRINRLELAVMGVSDEQAERFLAHPWYSPRRATVMIASLAALDLAAERGRYLDHAATARSEYDALFYQRGAELLRAWFDARSPIREIRAGGELPAAVTADGLLLVPAEVDHVVWSRRLEELVEPLRAEVDASPELERVVLLLSGDVSPRARAQLERRGVQVVEHAFAVLAPDARAPGAEAARPAGPVEEAAGR